MLSQAVSADNRDKKLIKHKSEHDLRPQDESRDTNPMNNSIQARPEDVTVEPKTSHEVRPKKTIKQPPPENESSSQFLSVNNTN